MIVHVGLFYLLKREYDHLDTSLCGSPIHKTRANTGVFLSDEIELFVLWNVFERVLEDHDIRIKEQTIHIHVEHTLNSD